MINAKKSKLKEIFEQTFKGRIQQRIKNLVKNKTKSRTTERETYIQECKEDMITGISTISLYM